MVWRGRGEMSAGTAIAIDLGGTQLRMALVEGDHIRERTALPSGVDAGPHVIFERIDRMIDTLCGGRKLSGIAGIGMCCAGPINTDTATATHIPTLPKLDNVRLGEELSRRTGLPARVENDGIAAALGEWRHGAGRGVRNMIYLTVSTGIGGGAIVDGRLLHGHKGIAAHIGHMKMAQDGPLCSCGVVGCFEALASGTAMKQRAMAAMKAATGLPVTVKCRIGIDDMDAEAGLDGFVDAVADAGVTVIYLHARKAWLNGLSPKENRDIPPLDHDRAARLAERRPDLDIILNGGLDSVDVVMRRLPRFAGAMLGRAAYRTPMILADILAVMDGRAVPTRFEVAGRMAAYADRHVAEGVPLHAITRHMLGLYHGQRGARLWRRHLGEEARTRSDGGSLIREVAAACEDMATGMAA